MHGALKEPLAREKTEVQPGATKVIINGTEFERRAIFEGGEFSTVVSYDWYINGLHVDAKTFKERFDEAARWRADQNGLKRPKPFALTKQDRDWLKSLKIKFDEEEEAA